MGEIMFIALVSAAHDGMQLKAAADWVLRRRILAVPGVAEVLAIGGDEKQYQVTLQPERLAAYGVTVEQVVRALRDSNQNVSAGFYVEGRQEFLVQGTGRIRRVEEIGETAVGSRGGQPILVRHLGEVGLGKGIVRGTGSHNGKRAVVLAIQKQPGANTLELTQQLDRTFEEIQAGLPRGMKIETRIFRQADFIERAIDNLKAALRDGALLVVAIVFVFLLSLRATAVTLIALPLSLAAAVLTLKALGATLNTMTLGGLAIALGALVDDAIIVVENIVRRLRLNPGAEPGEVVRGATLEMQGSIVFATLVIMLVFLPVFVLTGVEGRLMQPLALAYVVALAASLAVAVTVTPALALWLLPGRVTREPRWVASAKSRYERGLRRIVTHWRAIAVLSLAALLAAGVALWKSGRAFLPEFNEGSLTVNLTTLPGTSLEESDRLGQRVEEILLAQPEVIATARRTGRAPADPHAQEIHASEIEATLAMKKRDKGALLEALRKDLAPLAGVNVVLGQPISHRIDHMLSGTRSSVAVKIFGADLYELRRIGEAARQRLAAVPGAVDVTLEQQADIPAVTIALRRDAIARHGLSVREVSDALEAAFGGHRVTKVIEGEASFDLVVRYDAAWRSSMEAIAGTLITAPGGARMPLSALAEVRRDRRPNLVTRENVQRKIVVSANVAGRDLGGVVADARKRIGAEVPLPPGYRIEYGGQIESAAEATRTLTLAGGGAVLGIFLLLYLAFRSGRDALLVMLNLPLALIGGVAGMVLAGNVLSVATLVGFITLFGIATRNGVMMVAHIRHLMEAEGVRERTEAVVRGAAERLVPIVMTALAAGLALVPLALAMGEPGSEIQAPMAIVILCGLVSSTLLNMIVVPALYLRFGRAA
jgi:CzcA family heavy metal efflux pump